MNDSELSRFDVLTFDCYGTLIDWEKGLLAAMSGWFPAGRMRPADEELLAAYADCEAREERESPGHPYPLILEGAGRALAERFGTDLGDAEAAAFSQSVRDWPPFDDSKEALALLKQRYKLVILSNIDGESFAHSQKKLGCEFDAVITAEEVKHYKPDVRMFEAAFARVAGMGFQQDRILHVAQSLYHDHVPAKQLGMRTVHIDRRAGKPRGGATPPPQVPVHPDWTFNTLIDFARAANIHTR
ncbi:MAG: haloacid dehalogenase type II [Planctomycetota bacterium]